MTPSRRDVLALMASLPVGGATGFRDGEAVSRAADETDRAPEEQRPVAYVSEDGEDRWSFNRVGYGGMRGDLQVERLGDGRLAFRGKVWYPVFE